MNDKELNLNTVKGRVRWVYDSHLDSVQFDNVLIAIYENYFGETKYQEGSIKRAGRYWRQDSEKYVRSTIKLDQDESWKETFKGVFKK